MLKYVRVDRSCQVSSSESHMAHRNPRKNVPAESIYPTLRKSICFAAGGSPEKLTTCKPRNIDAGHDVARLASGSPEKLTTCKPRNIMPGVVPPKMVKSAKYCR